MKKNPAFNTLAVRTASGGVVVALVAGGVLLSPYTLAVLLIVICIGCLREFYSIAGLAGAEPQTRYGLAFGGLAVAVNFMVSEKIMTGRWMVAGMLLLVILFFITFIIELYRRREKPLLNISTTLTGVLYVAVPVSMMAYLGTHDPLLLMGFIVAVWANDVGAYLVGVVFGRHRLFERVSPKKSWEGFFGGLFFSVAIGIFMGGILPHPEIVNGRIFWGGLGLIAVISGVFGDLVESLIKRSVMIKDSGAIIPGHGGFLDRFDALLFSAPFVFVYFVIFALWPV